MCTVRTSRTKIISAPTRLGTSSTVPLQYDLEREILEDQDRLTPWRVELGSGPPDGVPHGFIPEDVLTEWHEFVVNRVLAREGGWGEFPRFVARFRDDPGLNDHEV